MQNDLWINKWRPNSVNDIIGNKSTITKLDNWISTFKQNPNSSIIINGKHGIGKTLSVQLLLARYNYECKIIYPDEIKSFRSDMDFDDYYNYDNSVKSKMNISSVKNKIALVLMKLNQSHLLVKENIF